MKWNWEKLLWKEKEEKKPKETINQPKQNQKQTNRKSETQPTVINFSTVTSYGLVL